MSRVTLKDVAREAGLSVTQVSRALNDHDDVAESTKEHARRVAAKLNYLPNLSARRLQDPGVRTGTIGLVLPSETLRFSDPFFGDLLSSMVAEAGRHGLQLQLSTPPIETDLVAPYDTAIRQSRVDGFVLVRTLVDDPRIGFLVERDFPFVSFGRPTAKQNFASVETAPDSFDEAISHLVELGHRRIACLAEPPQFAIADRRLASFRAAISRWDSMTDLDEPTVVVAGFHEDDGVVATTKLMTGPDRPTAIVALNDLLALGALRAAEQLSISVPDDLSVMGFDDISAARLVTPALTTIRQSATTVGATLIEELVPLLESGSPGGSERFIESSLVIRQTTGLPRI